MAKATISMPDIGPDVWIIIATDKPGMETVRLATRPEHRAYIWRQDLCCKTILGAPLVDPGTERMIGTWLMVQAPSRTHLEMFMAEEPYARAGIFNSVSYQQLHGSFDLQAQLNPQTA